MFCVAQWRHKAVTVWKWSERRNRLCKRQRESLGRTQFKNLSHVFFVKLRTSLPTWMQDNFLCMKFGTTVALWFSPLFLATLFIYLFASSAMEKQKRCQQTSITIRSTNEIYSFRNEWMSSFASEANLTGNVMPPMAKSNVQESCCSGLILAVKYLSKLTGHLTTL